MKKLFSVILSLSLILMPMPGVSTARAGSGSPLNQLMGIGNGVVGATIFTKCMSASMQPSLWLYLAGSLAYVGSEIKGADDKSEQIKESSKQLIKTKKETVDMAGGDLQKAAIEAQIKDEQDNLKFIKKRRDWIMAAKTLYSMAAIFGILEYWWSFSYPVGINKSADAQCTGDATAANEVLTKTLIMAYSSFMMAGGDLKGMFTGTVVMRTMGHFGMGVELATKAISATANAMSEALPRAAIFGGFALVTESIDQDLQDSEKDTEKRIADLNKVKNQFNGSENAIEETKPEGWEQEQIKGKTFALTALPEGEKRVKKCFSAQGAGVNYGTDCSKPLKLVKPTLPPSFNMPTLVNAVNVAHNLGQAVSDGDMGQADIEVANLASMAGRIDKIKKDMVDKLNDQLKKDGKKPIDFNESYKNQVAAVNDALTKANLGSGLANAGKAETGPIKEEAKAVEIKVPTPEIPLAAGVDSLKLDESGLANGEGDTLADAKNSGMDDISNYETNQSDILKRPEVSIFNQVSNRYFMNYTKLFDRKPAAPAQSTGAKK